MNHENSFLTADLAIVSEGHLVLIHRTKPPFADKLVLPGGHVEADETVLEAAVRELREETNLEVGSEELHFLMYLDRPDRDPRPGRRLSFVFSLDLPQDDPRLNNLRASDDAREIVWRPLSSLAEEEIGFDHFKVVSALLARN